MMHGQKNTNICLMQYGDTREGKGVISLEEELYFPHGSFWMLKKTRANMTFKFCL
jgi:hypothetical protein